MQRYEFEQSDEHEQPMLTPKRLRKTLTKFFNKESRTFQVLQKVLKNIKKRQKKSIFSLTKQSNLFERDALDVVNRHVEGVHAGGAFVGGTLLEPGLQVIPAPQLRVALDELQENKPSLITIISLYPPDLQDNTRGVKFRAMVKRLPRFAVGNVKILLSGSKFFS